MTLRDTDSEETVNALLNEYVDKWVNVTLSGRTLSKDYWNSLCLPFDMENYRCNALFGNIRNCRKYTGVDGNVLTFTAPEGDETFTAGTPFIVKPAATLASLLFGCVKIKTTEPQTVTNGDYSLKGTYGKHTLATDGTNLFLSTDGHFYIPSADKAVMNGLRAYIVQPAGSEARTLRISGIADGDDSATAITTARGGGVAATAVYDLSGRRVAVYDLSGRRVANGLNAGRRLSRGMYISGGRKFFIK